jgi:outer membrane protein assembly factor BamB
LRGPDDAFFTPGYRSKRVLRILGGSCIHDPLRGLASPNGDTPLPDGGLLVTEIGPPGWIDRLDARGRLVWSVQSPISYPSDAQLLPNGRILVSGFTLPAKIIEMTPSGRVTWSFGATSGPNMLAKPSLAVRFPNGLIASNDDYDHRVILIDPRTNRIVWQYGHTGVPGSRAGYLNKPDGLDLLPSAISRSQPVAAAARRRGRRLLRVRRIDPATGSVRRLGTLPKPLAHAPLVAVGGALYLVGGTDGSGGATRTIYRIDARNGTVRVAGQLPVDLADAAAVRVGQRVVVLGGNAVYAFKG